MVLNKLLNKRLTQGHSQNDPSSHFGESFVLKCVDRCWRVLLHVIKVVWSVCGTRGSCMPSDKLPQWPSCIVGNGSDRFWSLTALLWLSDSSRTVWRDTTFLSSTRSSSFSKPCAYITHNAFVGVNACGYFKSRQKHPAVQIQMLKYRSEHPGCKQPVLSYWSSSSSLTVLTSRPVSSFIPFHILDLSSSLLFTDSLRERKLK